MKTIAKIAAIVIVLFALLPIPAAEAATPLTIPWHVFTCGLNGVDTYNTYATFRVKNRTARDRTVEVWALSEEVPLERMISDDIRIPAGKARKFTYRVPASDAKLEVGVFVPDVGGYTSDVDPIVSALWLVTTNPAPGTYPACGR